MSLSGDLTEAFDRFLASTISKDLLRSIVARVGVHDVDTLIASIERLGDPGEYCKDDRDNKTVAGFFLYIDFISALLINLGDPAIQLASRYAGAKHPYVPWVVKYAGDGRFHGDILAKFDDVF